MRPADVALLGGPDEAAGAALAGCEAWTCTDERAVQAAARALGRRQPPPTVVLITAGVADADRDAARRVRRAVPSAVVVIVPDRAPAEEAP